MACPTALTDLRSWSLRVPMDHYKRFCSMQQYAHTYCSCYVLLYSMYDSSYVLLVVQYAILRQHVRN